jgi:hypothetical protein
MLPVHDVFLDGGAAFQKNVVLFLGAESHYIFHAGTVVPAAIEDDNFRPRLGNAPCSAAYTSPIFRDRKARAKRLLEIFAD